MESTGLGLECICSQGIIFESLSVGGVRQGGEPDEVKSRIRRGTLRGLNIP